MEKISRYFIPSISLSFSISLTKPYSGVMAYITFLVNFIKNLDQNDQSIWTHEKWLFNFYVFYFHIFCRYEFTRGRSWWFTLNHCIRPFNRYQINEFCLLLVLHPRYSFVSPSRIYSCDALTNSFIFDLVAWY